MLPSYQELPHLYIVLKWYFEKYQIKFFLCNLKCAIYMYVNLPSRWGIYDVDDCSSGAQALAEEGRVDKNCLCIDGGSAGGYTTLACLAFRTVFKAG